MQRVPRSSLHQVSNFNHKGLLEPPAMAHTQQASIHVPSLVRAARFPFGPASVIGNPVRLYEDHQSCLAVLLAGTGLALDQLRVSSARRSPAIQDGRAGHGKAMARPGKARQSPLTFPPPSPSPSPLPLAPPYLTVSSTRSPSGTRQTTSPPAPSSPRPAQVSPIPAREPAHKLVPPYSREWCGGLLRCCTYVQSSPGRKLN